MSTEREAMPEDATQSMINSVNSTDNVDEPKEPSRPEWLQEKFESPEQLAKAYDELQRKLGQSKQPAPDLDKQETLQDPAEQTEQPDRSQQVDQSAPLLPGLDNDTVESISDYAWENQSLSDDHYETLAKAGYSRDMVDAYMAGQFTMAEQGHNQLMEAGGGEGNVQTMFQWAQQNLPEQQITAYDEMFDRGGPEALMAMENLRAKFDNAGGSSAWQGVVGANAPSHDTSVFQSNADVIEAMSDPRYHTNPTYQRQVIEKLNRSNVKI